MTDNKICVYAICKNEAKFVERWYNSMKEADCIVVLDTGSTDNTVEELKRVGVNIVETKVIDPWRFDVARNESLKLVPEGYNILVCTDLDETFEAGWADKVKEVWNENVERIEYKYSWSHYDNGHPNQSFLYNKIHSRKWIWKYPVHECLVRESNNSENYTREERIDLYKEIHLHHYPDPEKSRGSYLGLLELRHKEYPEDKMGALYLAREYYLRSKIPEAINAFNELLSIKKEGDTFFSDIVVAYCHYTIGNCYRYLMYHTKDISEKDTYMTNAITSFERGIKANPKYISNYIGEAYVFNEIENYKLALVILKKALKTCIRYYHWLEPGSVWTYELFNNLAVASNKIGNKVEALGYATLAYKLAPNEPMIKNNYYVCLNDTISIKDII